jgi:hypothetical protein
MGFDMPALGAKNDEIVFQVTITDSDSEPGRDSHSSEIKFKFRVFQQ